MVVFRKRNTTSYRILLFIICNGNFYFAYFLYKYMFDALLHSHTIFKANALGISIQVSGLISRYIFTLHNFPYSLVFN